MNTKAEQVEDLDYGIAAHQRKNSTEFQNLCAMSLAWMSHHVDQDVLREEVLAQVFPPKKSSPQFSKANKESTQ